MKFGKTLGWCGLMALTPPALAAGGVTEVVVYADAGYPPYAYQEGGMPRGVYTDILKQAFSRMKGYSVTIRAEPWPRILASVKRGEYFAFYPPYQHRKERPYVEPYSVAILEERVEPLCREAVMHAKRTRFPDDFGGLRILRNASFAIGGEGLASFSAQGRIQLAEVASTSQALRMIAANRADCYLGDPQAVGFELRANPVYDVSGKLLTLLPGPEISRNTGHVGYAADGRRFPFKDDFVRQLDAILSRMRQNGEIDAIAKRHFKQENAKQGRLDAPPNGR
ncbi:substrate-binding periplasmic protein [Paludibacterium paludis]|uniref:ABC transporter substrate-binding protein n=1 Tax=Paludibacterium paludis TaxID=1225769 RepID=A0A918P1L9_9NEIS|nr:transporter substrate-binding domain-containing protein [Paludibacterium paludis]GGY14041.1 ABC transporter substrate-binding protein [Paludibacterium paludis]